MLLFWAERAERFVFARLKAAAGKGKSPGFHRKTRGVKTGASSSAAMANAVTAEFTPSIDRKKRRFLGLFCRKTGVRAKENDTLLCVFTCFWDSWLFQTLATQGEPARGRLQNKSCLKTYRRFFVRSGMCLNKSVKVEMTGRDEGCGRRAALRAAALLSAPPTTALQSETCGSKRRPISVPSRRRDAIRGNFDESGCNPTATGLQLPARNCTRLHQIAPNCTRLRSLRQKIKREKNRPEAEYSAPIYCPHLFACKVAEASRLLVVKVQRRDSAATFPGSLMLALGRLSGTLNPIVIWLDSTSANPT